MTASPVPTEAHKKELERLILSLIGPGGPPRVTSCAELTVKKLSSPRTSESLGHHGVRGGLYHAILPPSLFLLRSCLKDEQHPQVVGLFAGLGDSTWRVQIWLSRLAAVCHKSEREKTQIMTWIPFMLVVGRRYCAVSSSLVCWQIF